VADNDSDEQLGALLDSALRTHQPSDHVDVAALAAGSRRRARQIRSRRTGLIGAAAALLVAVPVGYQVLAPNPHGSAGSESAALLPSGAAHGIPNSMALSPAELPKGLTLTSQGALPAGSAPASGLACRSKAIAGSQPLSGRQWRWGSSADGTAVTLTISRWAGGTGKKVFADLAAGIGQGRCHWADPQVLRHDAAIAATDDTWASKSDQTDQPDQRGVGRAHTLIRVADLIAAVDVRDLAGAEAAAEVADRLAATEAKHLSLR
jgi:hypothetical protein